MAGATSAAKTAKEARSESNLVVPLVLLLLLGAGAGFGYGMLIEGSHKEAGTLGPTTKDAAALAKMDKAAGAELNGTARSDWRSEELVPLQPLIVRMGGGGAKWLRLEGAVAFSRPSKEDRGAIAAQLGEDLMLFLASTKMEQIASPTGLEFLRDDMNDIVQSRTGGEASRFVLKSLVVE